MSEVSRLELVVGLSAVIVAVEDMQPKVFVVKNNALPFGTFDQDKHSTLEKGLMQWVKEQTPIPIKYVEQLYTFSNRSTYFSGRGNSALKRFLSVGYIALTNNHYATNSDDGKFLDWYGFFPWEDWRKGKPVIIEKEIIPFLKEWADKDESKEARKYKNTRIDICFGKGEYSWDEEKVMQRYELLYEAELIPEFWMDHKKNIAEAPRLISGSHMIYDHRRILATAISRLRGKLKYRPFVYELMSEEFTLLRLQKAMEAIAGKNLHKQNFRRFVESSGMIESVPNKVSTEAKGRPAGLFKFKREVAINHFI